MLETETNLTEPQVKDIAKEILTNHRDKITVWEVRFLSTICQWSGRLSVYQVVVVEKIASRFFKEKP